MNRICGFILIAGLSLLTLAGFTGCPSSYTEICDESCPAIKLLFHIKNKTGRSIDIDFKYVTFFKTDSDHFYSEQNGQGSDSLGADNEVTWDLPSEAVHNDILSFQLIIDGKRYAGWKEEDGPRSLNNDTSTVEYGIGYMIGYKEDGSWYPFLSNLTPKEKSFFPLPLDSLENRATRITYQVTVIDEGVEFELEKVEEPEL
jgi:hypothetical protein